MGEAVKFSVEKIVDSTLDEIWPQVEQALLASPETWSTHETLDSIQHDLYAGRSQLFTLLDENRIVKVLVMTRLLMTEKGMVFQIHWAQGTEAAAAVMSIDWAESYAQSLGCYRIEVEGRPGWQKLLAPYGYREATRIVAKDLSPIRKDH